MSHIDYLFKGKLGTLCDLCHTVVDFEELISVDVHNCFSVGFTEHGVRHVCDSCVLKIKKIIDEYYEDEQDDGTL